MIELSYPMVALITCFVLVVLVLCLGGKSLDEAWRR
ncbi:hypothetical protein GobsT_60840 [Gemmata obscuriglobus]|nr:hypothetical protein GobsT_60840 [Gemmata obscuriglobus]VTS10601.1 unnamed protein product [Gemmata obscuriglobus UQM 2246]